MLSLGVNHAIGGLHPFGDHLVNLLFQISNTLLILALGRRLALSIPAAWCAAALFAAHPMLSEPVAEIVGRMDLVAGGALLSKVHVVVYPALALVFDLLWGGWRPLGRHSRRARHLECRRRCCRSICGRTRKDLAALRVVFFVQF